MAIKSSDWIWHDGGWCSWDDATVHITAHALHYGSSAFEGIRCYETETGPAIFRLEEHMRRLIKSAKLLHMDLPYSVADLESLGVEMVQRNGLPSCYIRPIVYRGSGAMGLNPTPAPVCFSMFCFEWGQYLGEEALEKGVDIAVSSWRRFSSGSMMPLGKIGGQYINNSMASVEAKRGGFTEAVMLDESGMVAEGAGQNLFLVLDDAIWTPPRANSILRGITRDTILALAHEMGIEVRQERIPREMLYLADEIFMTGTASEVTPVRSVDHMAVGSGGVGPWTLKLQEGFFDIVTGKAEDSYGWLTPVPALQAASA